jgi:hypothetical protein
MVVAVVAVRVVQPAVHKVIDVVAVRDEGVTAALVAAGARDWYASRRVRVAHLDRMLIVVALVLSVQVAVVQVVHVVAVLDANVAAVRAMDVRVLVVRGVTHRFVPLMH